MLGYNLIRPYIWGFIIACQGCYDEPKPFRQGVLCLIRLEKEMAR